LGLDLDTSLQYVRGVGPARAAVLENKGLRTVEDLLAYPPFRYEDRTNVKSIAQLAPGEMATIIAEVRSSRMAGLRKRGLNLFEAIFSDGSGADLRGKWFHGGYLADRLTEGVKLALYGKIELDSYTGDLLIMHPEFELLTGDDESDAGLHTGRIVPIYEAAGKITTRVFRTLIHRLLESLPELDDPFPERLRASLKLPGRAEALRRIHFPGSDEDLRLLNSFRTQAQIRFILEEFFWLECGMELKRAKAKLQPGIAFERNDRVRARILEMLPFKPTKAQKRAFGEIAGDMAEAHPMSRLLEGDVGSGKTLVAIEASILAIENGYQVAVLAPTEILARQHHAYFERLLKKLGYTVTLLAGSQPAREKKQIKKLIASGLAKVAVGTHALIEGDVEFQRLGLAIIDEQHRFGVMQRLKLMQKGLHPDVLVMTATPIPRTLAMTFYGDLDVSIIDEPPPGRKQVITRHATEEKIEQVYSFLKKQVDAGRQAYVIYPVIEESETQTVKAAEKMYEHLSRVVFPQLSVDLLHGKLTPDRKEDVMGRFKRGGTQILVATTVVEVGVDVPNATVMVIEQAERFGLAQLHQLRGRVGRGREQSYCILVTGKMNEIARERIRTMLDSSDGFHIAEMDMKLRGPGEFFGTKQAGLPALRFANLVRDQEILGVARREAAAFVSQATPGHELQRAVEYIRDHWQRRYALALVG
jgi:ATP-dependent DNA helicase RecG